MYVFIIFQPLYQLCVSFDTFVFEKAFKHQHVNDPSDNFNLNWETGFKIRYNTVIRTKCSTLKMTYFTK